MRVYLVGFMGAGKSTMGKLLANEMQTNFYDLDEMMVAKENMSISQIFEQQGETYFRKLESDCLRSTNSIEAGVIATGGGLPCTDGNMDWMLKHGVTVYLEWPSKQLLEHVINLDNRPLAKNGDLITLGSLLQNRIPYYEKSAITISCRGDLEVDAQSMRKLGRYLG